MGLRRGWGAALAVVVAMAAGCDCARIEQRLFVDMADPALQPLLDACKTHTAGPNEVCPPASTYSYPDIDCGCLPLCRRMLEIADQFSGIDSIEECHYVTPYPTGGMMMGGTPVKDGVSVTYRPSTCP